MSYDPKLREAMAEIEDVLKRYDCAGLIFLHSKTHGEFKYCIEHPTWSNFRFVRQGKAVHIKLYAKSEKENTNATVAMLADMRDQAAQVFQFADQAMDTIERQVKVEHIPLHKRITNEDRDDGA